MDNCLRVLFETSRAAIAVLADAGLGVAPHSLRAVTPGELDEVLRLAPSGPVHIHAAEQVKEVADCVAWSGLRPVAWLMEHHPVDGRWCLIHATHLDDAEVAGLACSGAVASRSERLRPRAGRSASVIIGTSITTSHSGSPMRFGPEP